MFGKIGKALGGLTSAIAPVPILGSVAALGGDLLAAKGQRDTNAHNLRIAREQMDFQERMANNAMDYQSKMVDQALDYQTQHSNTAYQRGMADMRKAGLNPILAYQQGGASTPIGLSAPGHAPVGAQAQMANPMGVFSGSAQNMAQTASTVMDVPQKRENIRLTQEEQKRIQAQVKVLGSQFELNYAQRQRAYAVAGQALAMAKKIEAETTGVEADNVQRVAIAEFIESAEFVAAAKYLGVTPSVLAGFVRSIIFRGRRR